MSLASDDGGATLVLPRRGTAYRPRRGNDGFSGGTFPTRLRLQRRVAFRRVPKVRSHQSRPRLGQPPAAAPRVTSAFPSFSRSAESSDRAAARTDLHTLWQLVG